MRPSGSPEALERRRRRAVDLLDRGYAPVDVARRLGVDRRTVRRWKAAYHRHGIDGIAARPGPGRPSKLDDGLRQQLVQLLLRGAQAAGYPTDLWTCPRVAGVIGRRFGVHYHVDHVGRLLHALGFSPQKPQRRARERDEEAIQRWICQDWPRIKKKPSG